MNRKKPKRFTKNFSKRLVELMSRNGLSSERSESGVNFSELAKAVNCSNQMARKYSLGEALPDPHTIVKIAQFLDVSPGWLLFGENRFNPTDLKQTELIGIDYELLRYILLRVAPLFSTTHDSTEVVNFVMDIVYDSSHLDTDHKTILKIIDISVSSAGRFQKPASSKREDNDDFRAKTQSK